ncbi:PspC domain-containing protein [Bounagaea algeriensis]
MNDTRSAVGSIETTVRDFWTSRPVRPATGGKLGGVAAAIGNRYAVDPVLLRVAFVVAALYGGSGVLLYLLGWMFLPREERDASGQVSTRTTSTPVLVVLAVLLIPALYALRNLPGLIGVVVGFLALYLLHRNRAEPGPGDSGPGSSGPGDSGPGSSGPGGSPGSAATPPGGPASGDTGSSGPAAEVIPPGSTDPGNTTSLADAAQTTQGTGASAEAESTRAEPVQAETARAESEAEADTDRFTARQPPAVDPWNAPFAEDVPDAPAAAGPVPERPRFDRMLTPVTLLLAALAAAGGLYLAYDLTTILAATLGVLGLGMLVGSVLRRGRVLVLLAVPVAVLTVLAAGATPHRGSTPPETPAPAADADRHVVPTTAAEANRAHTLEAGNMTLDLRGIPPQEAARVHHVQADTGAGGVTVHVPADWDVTAHCSSWAGTVDCLGTERSGAPARQTVTDHGEGARNGRLVTITAHAGTGYVEVLRD